MEDTQKPAIELAPALPVVQSGPMQEGSILKGWRIGVKMKQLLAYVLISLAAIGALYALHELDKSKALAVQAEVFKTRLEEATRASEQKARDVERSLADASVKKEQEKNEKLQEINSKQLAIINSLSKRPSRPQDGSLPSIPSQACTGRELYKEDGEFLIREAARADKIIIERDFYYERYEDARKKLDEYSK